MSDATPVPSEDPEPEPDTWTEDGDELEMVRGSAYHRTAEPVVFADARCIGCQNVTVCSVPADAKDWTEKSSFADGCGACSMLTPHNIVAPLNGLNRTHDRGRVPGGDGDG